MWRWYGKLSAVLPKGDHRICPIFCIWRWCRYAWPLYPQNVTRSISILTGRRARLVVATIPSTKVERWLKVNGAPLRLVTLPPDSLTRSTPAAMSHSFFGPRLKVASAMPAATRASLYAMEPHGRISAKGSNVNLILFGLSKYGNRIQENTRCTFTPSFIDPQTPCSFTRDCVE